MLRPGIRICELQVLQPYLCFFICKQEGSPEQERKRPVAIEAPSTQEKAPPSHAAAVTEPAAATAAAGQCNGKTLYGEQDSCHSGQLYMTVHTPGLVFVS